jgi:hypothetical protein
LKYTAGSFRSASGKNAVPEATSSCAKVPGLRPRFSFNHFIAAGPTFPNPEAEDVAAVPAFSDESIVFVIMNLMKA